MSELSDKMLAAIETLKTDLAGSAPTDEQIAAQIHAVVDPQIATLTEAVARFDASETKDEAAIADLQGAVTAFTDAFAPAAPAPTEEPPAAA